jgi:hypothetical protein|tara:strand:- start:321 stop:713 length:393 start_codon:yes stop_codon:yes gene_type:complete
VGHKYKDKYISLKDIYNKIKLSFSEKINYKLYYKIIVKYLEILLRDAVQRNRKVALPNKMGYVSLEQKIQTRAFHYRVDNEATKQKGETVFYKVPILEDYYKKLVWSRPRKYRYCKLMALSHSKKIINNN